MGADIFQDIDSDRVGFDVNENIVHRKAGVNRWLSPVSLTAEEIASPTADILADTSARYKGPAPDYVEYYSNTIELVDDSLTTTLLSGELQQFNRMAGGSIASYSNKTADGVIAAAPCICYGYIVTVAMSAAVTNVYDNASAASGTILFVIPASTAVGTYAFNAGVLCANGLYADFVGTGTVNFLYVPTGG